MVGEASGEEQLFSSENSSMMDSIGCELNTYLEKIKVLKMVAAPSRLCLMKAYMLCLMKTYMYISFVFCFALSVS